MCEHVIKYKYAFLLKAIYSYITPTDFKQLWLNTEAI